MFEKGGEFAGDEVGLADSDLTETVRRNRFRVLERFLFFMLELAHRIIKINLTGGNENDVSKSYKTRYRNYIERKRYALNTYPRNLAGLVLK